MDHGTINQKCIQETTQFHGHWCPGLAIGIRAAEWVLRELGTSPDEEIAAVVETDMCGVDAVQYLTGCTFGKGNLIHLDYGKNAFSFYRRRDGKAMRLVLKGTVFADGASSLGELQHKKEAIGLTDEEERLRQDMRAALSSRIMESELESIFDFTEPAGPAPRKARILTTLPCEGCGESVMESRIRRLGGRFFCIPCFTAMDGP